MLGLCNGKCNSECIGCPELCINPHNLQTANWLLDQIQKEIEHTQVQDLKIEYQHLRTKYAALKEALEGFNKSVSGFTRLLEL